jgi:hypothetical protein
MSVPFRMSLAIGLQALTGVLICPADMCTAYPRAKDVCCSTTTTSRLQLPHNKSRYHDCGSVLRAQSACLSETNKIKA